MRHIYRKGTSIKGVLPDAAAAELERIRSDRGALTARNVVDESRPEEALLHPAFEWDDKKAGEEYRLSQARSLCRNIFAAPDQEGHEPAPVYVHIQSQEAKQPEGDYRPIASVVQHVDQFALALGELERRVRSALEAVRELKQAANAVPGGDDRMVMIAMAVKALETASMAVSKLH